MGHGQDILPPDGTKYKKGEPIVLQVNVTDEDGDGVTATWRDGDKVLGTGSPLEVTLKPGKHTITVVVSDGTEEVEESITVTVKEDRESPSLGIVASLMAMGLAGIVTWRRLGRVDSR